MPHTRSAKKNVRKTEKRRLHNRAVKKSIKTEIKKFLDLVKTGSADELLEELKVVAKKLDKAAARHIIHRNLAARKKSQLARMLHRKASAAPAPTR
jgi:small subunit ribosomal protein S20